ncbi:acyl-CoA thioesterase [Marmoricola sp. RAF53]|uniref:acyl-CoA thioesterase n=1 Tax=Marmoricola sp. RAF53 TaxID=3233059 RepID=UPI003F9A98CE
MPETFTCEIQARLRDINAGGHVDNVEAIRVVEEARIRFFGLGRDGHGDGLTASSPAHVTDLVASQRVDYRAEMRFATFQPFVVRMWVGSIGRSSFTVQSEVRLAGPEHPAAVVAETAVVMWSHEHQRSWEHGPELRASLERFLAEPVDLRGRPPR